MLDRAGDSLAVLKDLIQNPQQQNLVVAGVDFSHVGLNFGHRTPPDVLEGQATAHDQALVKYLCTLDTEAFWPESARVEDRYHVCGFSSLAVLLEILPQCRGRVLDYRLRHEPATPSTGGFAAAVFCRTDSSGLRSHTDEYLFV